MTRFIVISRCASPADRLCALEEHVSAAAQLPTRRRPRAVASRLCCQCRLVGDESAALAANDVGRNRPGSVRDGRSSRTPRVFPAEEFLSPV